MEPSLNFVKPGNTGATPVARRLLATGTLLLAAILLLCLPGAARAGWEKKGGIDYGKVPGRYGVLNQLDLYLPTDQPAAPAAGSSDGLSPIVVYVHGGAWMGGDKKNRIEDKVRLFTDAGYLFASVNYRLSPPVSVVDPPDFDPGRIRFPVQAEDVAGAIGWIAEHADNYGGDPDSILLVGHSAGAHLVSLVGTSPGFLAREGVSPEQVLGVVPLDTAAYSVSEDADPGVGPPSQRTLLFWHVFGSPAEEGADPGWSAASPIDQADPGDPRHLLVTQSGNPGRISINRRMAAALGQDPETVLLVPLDHAGINAAVGAPGDPTAESAAILEFMAGRVAAQPPLKVSVRKRPAKRVRIGPKARKRRVVFKFRTNRSSNGVQCRIDRRKFRRCRSHKSYRLRKGRHVFRVRAVYPSGRTSPVRKVRFRIIKRKRQRR